MLNLNAEDLNLKNILEYEASKITGMTYIPDYINLEEQEKLLNIIDQQLWSIELQRRIQQYGYTYEHLDGIIVSSQYWGALPDWANSLAKRLSNEFSTTVVPDQLLINEYLPGQGCKNHIDCIPCFNSTIFILSFLSQCVMNFTQYQTKEKTQLLLLPGSLLVLQGAARYHWLHGIDATDKDRYNGKDIMRSRRISMTFRKVLFPHQ
ncbi:MAG: alpha-ketoglutarate-dependent dioxygenase AlkB [Symploca sp. SIO3C6]|uniref:Alpha-ketoglutarate-dependent dioxygenase AlkB n=1 Tax=Symploca sp. SIO1C4 TaxID=2607765 RepID=A0A6B3NJY1_9CYAN|nr:alpha-ketoglutarate-dependent dioxygenase AlkB [Symploca sp. SIO3C6]NER31937.1 alpha-ketoglutarate-dependent dioxygenase AlkB [Symploca sp. SIO1C4]NET04288.1 alpha-ketoglutarate-dependent dioxygenase AlkB [Symploca sp. SIO2B6]